MGYCVNTEMLRLKALVFQFVQPVPVQQERHYFLKHFTLEYRRFPFSEVGYALSLLAAGQYSERDIYHASLGSALTLKTLN